MTFQELNSFAASFAQFLRSGRNDGYSPTFGDPNFYFEHLGMGFAFFVWFLLVTCLLALQLRKAPREFKPEKPSIEHMSGLRWFAATFIIGTHYLEPSIGDRDGAMNFKQLWFLLRGGDTLVSLFIMMSGFFTHLVYSETLHRTSLPMFYARRLGRILPVYYLAHFVTLYLVWNTAEMPPKWDYIGATFFVSTWWHDWSFTNPNRMLWTVVTLFWCWLWFPFLSSFFNRIRPRTGSRAYSFCIWSVGISLTALIAWLPSFVIGSNLQFDYYRQLKTWPPLSFMTFAAGACIAEATLHMPPIPKSWVWGVVMDASFVGAVIPWWNVSASSNLDYFEGFFVHGYLLLWAVFMLAGLHGRGLVHRVMSHPVLSTLGEYAFQMYCFQCPVFTWLRYTRRRSRREAQPLNEWCMAYLLVIVVSVLVMELIERPYLRWLRAWSHGKRVERESCREPSKEQLPLLPVEKPDAPV